MNDEYISNTMGALDQAAPPKPPAPPSGSGGGDSGGGGHSLLNPLQFLKGIGGGGGEAAAGGAAEGLGGLAEVAPLALAL